MAMSRRTLDIQVVSAKDLKDVNLFSKMEVYVVVFLSGDPCPQKSKVKTSVDRDGGCNPTWNFPIKLTIDEALALQNCLTLVFKLKCERTLGDEDVGQVSVPVKELIDSPGDGKSMQFVDYQVRSRSGKFKGVLTFSYRFREEVEQPKVTENKANKADQLIMAYTAAVAGTSPMPYAGAVGYPPPSPQGYGYPPPPPQGYGNPPPSLQGSPQGYGNPPAPQGYRYPPPPTQGFSNPPPSPQGYGNPPPSPQGYSYPPRPEQGYGNPSPSPQGYGYPPPPPQGYGYRPQHGTAYAYPPPSAPGQAGYVYPPPPQGYGYGAYPPVATPQAPKKERFGVMGFGAEIFERVLGRFVEDKIYDEAAFDGSGFGDG